MNRPLNLPLDRLYKVVRPDKDNTDEYLVRFSPSKEEALKYAMEGKRKNADSDYIAKPTDIACIENTVPTDYSHYVCAMIPDAECERVFRSDAMAEISCDDLMCDARAYYDLSRIIPQNYTVIDIGCAYNAQSYLFTGHKGYISVNPEMEVDDYHFEYFRAPNTEHYKMSGQEFIGKVLPTLGLDLSRTFAICTYVPDYCCQSLVRKTFNNCYVYYPNTKG